MLQLKFSCLAPKGPCILKQSNNGRSRSPKVVGFSTNFLLIINSNLWFYLVLFQRYCWFSLKTATSPPIQAKSGEVPSSDY